MIMFNDDNESENEKYQLPTTTLIRLPICYSPNVEDSVETALYMLLIVQFLKCLPKCLKSYVMLVVILWCL